MESEHQEEIAQGAELPEEEEFLSLTTLTSHGSLWDRPVARASRYGRWTCFAWRGWSLSLFTVSLMIVMGGCASETRPFVDVSPSPIPTLA